MLQRSPHLTPERVAAGAARLRRSVALPTKLTLTIGLGFILLAGPALARPTGKAVTWRPHLMELGIEREASALSKVAFSTSADETTYFGGTIWDADSTRWEAIEDSCWTFDTGVGSHFNHAVPHVDPFKDPTLHAQMEGWIGLDRTYVENPYFRRLHRSQFPGQLQDICVINGDYSFWAGVLPAEAALLCYAGGQGYGNNWNVCIERTFTYNGSGNVTLQYAFENDTEFEFDFTYVMVDKNAAGDTVTVAAHNSVVSGVNIITLVPGSSLRSTPGNFKILYCVVTDEAYSDEDGSYPTRCGAFAVDDISVTGGGISYFTDFETGAGLGRWPESSSSQRRDCATASTAVDDSARARDGVSQRPLP